MAGGSCHRVLSLLSQSQDQDQSRKLAAAVAAFKRVVSLLSDSARKARFRTLNRVKSPSDHKLHSDKVAPKIGPSLTMSQLLPRDALDDRNANNLLQLPQRSFLENQKAGQHPSSAHRRFLPQQRQNNQTHQLQPHPPPKKTCMVKGEDKNGKCANNGRCHCSRKRKLRIKRSIKVPAVSDKLADITHGGSMVKSPSRVLPIPGGYYKCSSIRGCPAKKHAERCLEDPSMLLVTYEGEHNHTQSCTNIDTNLLLAAGAAYCCFLYTPTVKQFLMGDLSLSSIHLLPLKDEREGGNAAPNHLQAF